MAWGPVFLLVAFPLFWHGNYSYYSLFNENHITLCLSVVTPYEKNNKSTLIYLEYIMY